MNNSQDQIQNDTLRGTITHIRYKELTCTIGTLRLLVATKIDEVLYTSAPFKLLGNASLGDEVTLSGAWKIHKKYGPQFEARSATTHLPEQKDGLIKYIADNPVFYGIGLVKAKKLVEGVLLLSAPEGPALTTGKTFSEIIALLSPQEINHISKLRVDEAIAFKDLWSKMYETNIVGAQLAAWDLTQTQIRKIIDCYGASGVGQLKTNPYDLIGKIEGFGFATVDLIALRCGVAKSDKGRIKAALVYLVREAIEEGHTWIYRSVLLQDALLLLVMDELNAEQLIIDQFEDLTGVQNTKVDEEYRLIVDDQERVSTAYVYRLETEILERFKEISSTKNSHFWVGNGDANGVGNDALVDMGINADLCEGLNDQQAAGFTYAMEYQCFVFSGGAGSGKTFVIRRVVEAYQRKGFKAIELAAPTGKAAKRMQEVVGVQANTIHRLLKWCGGWPPGYIDADLIVIDESSMIDIYLFYVLIKKIDFNRTSVVLCGDHNQLNPVGPGNVFRDVLKRSLLPQVVLTKIVRQAGELRDNSLAILNGEVREALPGTGRKPWVIVRANEASKAQQFLLKLYEEALPDRMGFSLDQIQCLSPKKEGSLGVHEINLALQALYQRKLFNRVIEQISLIDTETTEQGKPKKKKRPQLYSGDRVIVTKNNYDLKVFNGDMGVITSILEGVVRVKIDGQEIAFTGAEEINLLELAYCMSVHKAQGSEFPCVVLIMHSVHTFVHLSGGKNLFYTGATRAKETLVIVGDQNALIKCAQREATDRRRTWLSVLDHEPAFKVEEAAQ